MKMDRMKRRFLPLLSITIFVGLYLSYRGEFDIPESYVLRNDAHWFDSGSNVDDKNPWNRTTTMSRNLPNIEMKLNSSLLNLTSLHWPTIYSFLPHLQNNSDSLQPAFVYGPGKQSVSVVLGIPTVKREQIYLLQTLLNIITNMNEKEQNETLIIVYIGEIDKTYISSVIHTIDRRLKTYVNRGLLQIIGPRASYYPEWNNLRMTLNDPVKRLKWRTKQNLDYAFLMMYSQHRGTFYVQLEDDIVTVPGFISSMTEFAMKETNANPQWFVIDFSTLGFIGKLFRSEHLSYMITYEIMFYNDNPVDWLIDPFLRTRYCPGLDEDRCKNVLKTVRVQYGKSLFQHAGVVSSLSGKEQLLKDEAYNGTIPLFVPHSNPPATITTSLIFGPLTFYEIYTGKNFAWSMKPREKDYIKFTFLKPVLLKSYKIRSGNYEHPVDLLYNTTVEIKLAEKNCSMLSLTANDQYCIIGQINNDGFAEGEMNWEALGHITEVCLNIHTASNFWIILSEVYFEEVKEEEMQKANKSTTINR